MTGADGPAPCRRLEFDSAFFGFEVARVHGDRLDATRAGAVLEWCRAHDTRCAYFLAAADDPQTVRAAEAHGFRLADVRVELERPVGDVEPATHADVRAAEPGDREALAPVAREGFGASRFFADDGFERERCRALYEQWLAGSLDGSLADAVFVLEGASGGPAGFVTCVDREDGRRIGLFAVAPGAAGAGGGGRLVQTALGWFAGRGAGDVGVATQARNVGALRVYGRHGFLVAATRLWYHRWFDA